MTALEILTTGPLTTVQDCGRFGWAAVGVGRSGAADAVSHDAANRLVGNAPDAGTLEVTLGGLTVRAHGDVYVAVAGAPSPVRLDGVTVSSGTGIAVPDGSELTLEYAAHGLRTYLAVRGGIAVPAVLGSRSTDTLAQLGPAPLRPGDLLPVGDDADEWPATDLDPYRANAVPQQHVLRVLPGPRVDRFDRPDQLVERTWTVSTDTDRIGMRLTGGALTRSNTLELPSEGMVLGAIQVPPDGHPVVFLADHPVTGGYPVIAVVIATDVHRAAQCAPGTAVRFTWQR